ncbi:MAG TPA: hypothetical protein VGV35_01390, partial [Bryobacteraceae bacterium]|nr:hypothetical protein [Bryobacteraceae bacterium]
MRSLHYRRARSANQILLPERLESRTLLSAWTIADDYQLAAGQIASGHSMASDSAGNVYAIGSAHDSSNRSHGIVREKLAGSTTWSTIEDYPAASVSGTSFYAVAVDSAGDLYVGGQTHDSLNKPQWLVLEKLAGGSAFTVVDNYATSVGGIGVEGLAIDGAGNVFAAGQSATIGKGNKATYYWTVRKRTGGVGAFTTVDNSISGTGNDNPYSATYIADGAAAGLYVVGTGTGSQWLVRKSIDAGVTWTTVDSFFYNSTNATALSVTGDGRGDVYVVGKGGVLNSGGVVHWLVRESINGGTSWSTVDNFGLGGTLSSAGSVGADLAGNIYVAGSASEASGTSHGIIRSNAGGSWTTVDVTGRTGDYNGF